MYVDSSPVTKHRRETARESADRAHGGAARRTRLADAIVSQWLLEQVPADRRRSASDRRRELTAPAA
jgi:hypothetical protein